jgi:hypothetical protein
MEFKKWIAIYYQTDFVFSGIVEFEKVVFISKQQE